MGTALGIAILGILASVATELITYINSKLNGTVLTGKGAFLLAIVLSLVGGIVKVWIAGDWSWGSISTDFAQVFAVSQVFFVFILQWLGIDTPSANPPVAGN